MQARQEEILAAAWAGRAPDLPLRSPEELLTLASIVEKETGRRRGAAAGGVGLRQPAEAGDAAADRPDGDLRHHQGRGAARAGLAGERAGDGDAVQHLRASRGCRRRRSPIPARRRSRRRPIPSRATISTSWPTAPAGTPSRGRWRSTTRNVAAWRRIEAQRVAEERRGRPRRPRRRPRPRRRRRRAGARSRATPGQVERPMPRAGAAERLNPRFSR